MEWLAKLTARWKALRHPEKVHRDMAEEWQLHIDLRTEENIRRGMSPEEARRAAEQHFGNNGFIRDLSWDVRGGGMIETIWQDLRFAARQLRKSPGFTFVALFSLTLGIGANTLIFSLINTALLRPLPIYRPDRIIAIHQGKEKNSSYSQVMSYPNYKNIRDRNTVFSGTAAFRFNPISISHNGTNDRLWGYLVSGNYFDVLGVKPFLGRTFAPEEDILPSGHPVVVLSYGCWQRQFGGDPHVIGNPIQINGHAFTLIGVAPPEFFGTETIFSPQFWIPSMMQEWVENYNGLEARGDGQWLVFGRLKDGASLSEARAELSLVAHQLAKEYPKQDDGMSLFLLPPGLVFPQLRSGVTAFSGALLFTVILVLLIACANLAGLLLARATYRRKEIAVRLAIGAGRVRLIRQLLTESLLLSMVGAALGLALGSFLMRLTVAAIPSTDIGVKLDLALDWRVLCFTLFLGLFTGLAFGLLPALQATKADVVATLKEDLTSRWRRAHLRSVLVSLQVALSLILLIVAGLVVRSLQQEAKTGPGFDPKSAFTMSMDLGLQGYDKAKGQAFYRQALERVRALPGVTAAGFITLLPLGLGSNTTGVYPQGQPEPVDADKPSAIYNSVSPGYFAAMGIPLVAGRDFAESDTAKSPDAVIINETLAEQFWPGESAVGKRLRRGSDEVLEVVGVAKNGKYGSLNESPEIIIYVPLSQDYSQSAALVVRTFGDPQPVITSVRSEIQKLDPTLPFYEVNTLTGHLGLALFPLHAAATAVGSFALLALILAAVGIYGVIAYSVGQRTQEIGIRIALGARAADISWMVLKHGAIIIAAGMALGLLGSFALSKVVASLLYGVSAKDPLTFLIIPLLLSAVALVASVLPARRAAKVDPVSAIKCL